VTGSDPIVGPFTNPSPHSLDLRHAVENRITQGNLNLWPASFKPSRTQSAESSGYSQSSRIAFLFNGD
jgi:hypothetical protein